MKKSILLGLIYFSINTNAQQSHVFQCEEKAVEIAQVLRLELGPAPLVKKQIENRYSESEQREIKVEVFIFDRGESGLVIEITPPEDADGKCRFLNATAWHD